MINALKHAFQDDKPDGQIVVGYVVDEPNWRLMVSDNGIGRQAGDSRSTTPGLGTGIIEALAKQLGAEVHIAMNLDGTSVSITHGIMPSLPASPGPDHKAVQPVERIAGTPLILPGRNRRSDASHQHQSLTSHPPVPKVAAV
jgi:hypothetical protein